MKLIRVFSFLFVIGLTFFVFSAYSENLTTAKKAIPSCFEDKDCPDREGLISRCRNPGKIAATCVYYDAKRIEAAVITDKNCPFCSTEAAQKAIKDNFIGVEFKTIHYKEPEAKKLIKKYEVDTLPFFIIDSAIKGEKNFDKLGNFFEEKEGKIIAKKSLSGIFLFLNRQERPERLELFLDFYAKNSSDIFNSLTKFSKENKIELITHFVTSKRKDAGYPEEEIKAALAIGIIYPKKKNDYINWRINNIQNMSWVNALDEFSMDFKRVKKLMKSKKMDKLVKENKKIAEELGVNAGNAILIKNNRLFRVFKIDTEQLKQFFKRK